MSKLRSWTSKTKADALFWKSHCVTCSPIYVVLYYVTGSCKEPICCEDWETNKNNAKWLYDCTWACWLFDWLKILENQPKAVKKLHVGLLPFDWLRSLENQRCQMVVSSGVLIWLRRINKMRKTLTIAGQLIGLDSLKTIRKDAK